MSNWACTSIRTIMYRPYNIDMHEFCISNFHRSIMLSLVIIRLVSISLGECPRAAPRHCTCDAIIIESCLAFSRGKYLRCLMKANIYKYDLNIP